MKKIILGIETSCDETSLALVSAESGNDPELVALRMPQGDPELVERVEGLELPKFKVLKSLVSSQIKIHRPFGGVVPMLAKREHIKNLPILWKRIMNYDLRFKNKELINHKSKFLNQIDIIAVTVGPGLEPALWAGIEFAKGLYKKLKTPRSKASLLRGRQNSKLKLVGVNHLEGHLYSFLLLKKRQKTAIFNSQFSIFKNFPAIILLVSGGHTILLLMKDLTHWKKLGETRDDAAGEAFDKVARMLGLPYPGGPEIEKLAATYRTYKTNRTYKSGTINFPRPMLNQKNYDFSFSGLKTAVLYHLRGQNSRTNADNTQINAEKFPRSSASSPRRSAAAADIAATFQRAVIETLVSKTIRAAKEYKAKSIILCGGVAANKSLQQEFKKEARKINCRFMVPPAEYLTDNAAMIAATGYLNYLRGKKYSLVAKGDLNI